MTNRIRADGVQQTRLELSAVQHLYQSTWVTPKARSGSPLIKVGLTGELVWSHTKRAGNVRRLLQKGEKLDRHVADQFTEIGKNPELVLSFF